MATEGELRNGRCVGRGAAAAQCRYMWTLREVKEVEFVVLWLGVMMNAMGFLLHPEPWEYEVRLGIWVT